MIEINNVSYKIGNKILLDNIKLQLASRQTIALIGANGAGKSTLLNLMARITSLQSGSIVFDDVDISNSNANRIAKKVAILQQSPQIASRLKVRELLMFARFPYHFGRPQAADYRKLNQILDYFALHEFADRFIDQLSGGQRQMVLVAMVFCQDTDYILLDEPLNNLDINHASKLMQTLQTAIHDWQKTIVLVLHDINYAAHYADYLVAINNGALSFAGTTKTVLNAENIGKLYGINVEIIEYNERKICLHY